MKQLDYSLQEKEFDIFSNIKQWLNAPDPGKPKGFRDHQDISFVGRQPGKLHLRYDCEHDTESRGYHIGAAACESVMLMFIGVVEFLFGFLLWFADLVPDILKYGAVLIVGLAIAAAITVAGVSIGAGLALETDVAGLWDLIDKLSGI